MDDKILRLAVPPLLGPDGERFLTGRTDREIGELFPAFLPQRDIVRWWRRTDDRLERSWASHRTRRTAREWPGGRRCLRGERKRDAQRGGRDNRAAKCVRARAQKRLRLSRRRDRIPCPARQHR